MERTLWIFFLFLLGRTSSLTLPNQGIAPSLALDRIGMLRDSIEKLQQINEKVRCRIREWRRPPLRSKRFIGPAQRLEDLIAPLSLSFAETQEDC